MKYHLFGQYLLFIQYLLDLPHNEKMLDKISNIFHNHLLIKYNKKQFQEYQKMKNIVFLYVINNDKYLTT